MKKQLGLAMFFLVVVLISFNWSLFVFFAQDDFILINHFSQNSFLIDLQNVFGKPLVSHWRPMHNLFFFIAGNLFERNFFLYHLLSVIVHSLGAFFVFKLARKLTFDTTTSLFTGTLYAINPSHFASIAWISGGAMTIGFLFFILSCYLWLKTKKRLSLAFFALSLLASEAMFVGIFIILLLNKIYRGLRVKYLDFINFSFICLLIAAAKITIFRSESISDVYSIEFSIKTLYAFKYYVARVLGLAEISGDLVVTFCFLTVYAALAMGLILKSKTKKDKRLFIFLISTIAFGILPLIIIPKHLSAHYANISIFGFSLLIGQVLSRYRPLAKMLLFSAIASLFIFNINLARSHSWVVDRANLAKSYIEKIEDLRPAAGSTLFIQDGKLFSSESAYIALGSGKAVDFWFREMQYGLCFEFLKNCNTFGANIYFLEN